MSEYLKSPLDPNSTALQQLRHILKESGYCNAGTTPALDGALPELPDESAPATQLNTFLRLFYAQVPVGAKSASSALHPLTIEQLLDVGLLRQDGENVTATVFVQPYGNLFFAFGQLTPEVQPEDVMMIISSSSLEIAHLMVRHSSRNTLDLGTGCGFLAALLAPHSEHVYAVDVSPTAVQLADFNCRWNELRNVTCLEGNLLEHVRDMQFDLIVCNPPFMICPVPGSSASQFRFRHSGNEGDEFCIRLACDAAQLLTEGGYFHMIFDWLEVRGKDWKARLKDSFSGTGCDVWGMRLRSQAAEDYVAEWVADIEKLQEVEAEPLYREGMQYFQRRNGEAIGRGLLTMRRCSTRPNFLWFDEAPEDRSEPYGESVSTIFDIRAYLGNCNDSALLQEKLMASPDLGMIQRAQLKDGRWNVGGCEFYCEEGLKYFFSDIDPLVARLVAYLGENCTLRQAFERLSGEDHLALEELITKHLPEIRELVWFGFLIPVSIAKPPGRQ
jgi:methylase of polypeptide subunit release factors